jgi:AcrR family transcriptional regulator
VSRPDFDSREALIAAAHVLLVQKKGLAVTLSAICAHAGVDAAMVRYHFGSRRGLMISVFERLCAAWVHELDDLLALDLSPSRKLEIHLRQVIRNYRRQPYANRLMTELISSSHASMAKRLSRSFVHPIVDFHRRLIEQGVAAGEFRPVDPTYFFCSVIGMSEFQFAAQPLLRAALGAARDDETVEAEFVAHTAALVLNGVQSAKLELRQSNRSGKSGPGGSHAPKSGGQAEIP